MSLAPVLPEIQILAERGLLYPPVSIVLVETTPNTNPEMLFLYLVHRRVELSEGEILVVSLLEDFETSLETSIVPSPLIAKFRGTLEHPRIHYRFFEKTDEMMRALELHYKDASFIYVYMAPPFQEVEVAVGKVLSFIRRIRSVITRTFGLTLFIDATQAKTMQGRELEYLADIVFELVESGEGSPVSVIRVKRTKYQPKPDVSIEYSIGREDIVMQVVRSI